ncbi:MAG: flagellar hook-length control protein FliK [Acidobacteriaceae bacterium]
MTVNSADHIGFSKQPSPASSQASRAASEKRTTGAGVTGSLIGGVIAPASVEASAGGMQGVGTVSSAAANPAGAGINSPGVGASNLYDRIDQGAAPVVLHSGAQHVSVGVQDPNLGWVEIQAQNTAGHVDATLVTASGQTHASLAAQLPSMAQYLQQRDVRVGTLLVHHHVSGGGSSAAGGGGSAAGGGGSGYGSANSGTGAHHSNAGNSGGGRAAPRLSGVSAGRVRSGQGMGGGVQGGDDGAAFRPVSYISVRA